MSPLDGFLIIACGIAVALLFLWSLWRAFMQPWLQNALDELREDNRDGGR